MVLLFYGKSSSFLVPCSPNRFAKRLLKIFKRKKKEREQEKKEDDSLVRWEKDYELVPLSQHGLFFEYLELGKAVLDVTHITVIGRELEPCSVEL